MQYMCMIYVAVMKMKMCNENVSINLRIFKYIWSNHFVQLIYFGRRKKKHPKHKQHSNNHNTTHQYINPYVVKTQLCTNCHNLHWQ